MQSRRNGADTLEEAAGRLVGFVVTLGDGDHDHGELAGRPGVLEHEGTKMREEDEARSREVVAVGPCDQIAIR